jgi:uncharacterized protein
MTTQESATYEPLTELEATSPTLIEGLPGHGLVAAIAVDQISRQLDLDHHGNVVSESFPPVATYQHGLVHDLVRIFAGTDPDVLTLQSDLALPPDAFEPLAKCLIGEFADAFERAIFITGVPAESESRIGDIAGVATTEEMRADLEAAGIERADDPGLIAGITGAIVKECYHADIPAIVIVVRAHPFLPDPGAAQRVIEDAIEPLVDFDIDTTELREQADEIQRQMQQLAEQYEQMLRDHQGQQPQQSHPGMYQ